MLRRLRSRIKARPTVVFALATAGALAVAGIALAAANSTVPGFSFSPNNPHGVLTPGKPSVHTHPNYTNPGIGNPGGAMKRMQLNLDDDFQFNPGAFPTCDPTQFTQSTTMAEAMAVCGPAGAPSQNAWLWPANSTTSNGTVELVCAPRACGPALTVKGCVLVFNGQGSTSEVLLFIRADFTYPITISCANPKTNTQGDFSRVLRGDLKANPAVGSDYTDPDSCSAPDPRRGCQLDINNINNTTAEVPFPLSDLNVGITRGNYVRARCVDPPAGNRKWNLRALFTYNDNTTQTLLKTQTCT